MVIELRKLVITGNTGSGKTTLARKLARLTSLPIYHLDSVIYEKNWKKRSRALIQESISEITAKDSWIIDGVSKQVYEKADCIVFLDYPLVVSFSRAIFRMFLGKRKELPKGCREIDACWLILKLTYLFPIHTRPLILSFKELEDCRFYHITSDNGVVHLIEDLKAEQQSLATSSSS